MRLSAPEHRPAGPPPNPRRFSGIVPQPSVGDAFWRGLVIGMALSAVIAWLAVIAWRIVLWLM